MIKKIVTPNTPEETELDNVYQKTLISGIENKVKQSDQKKSPAQMKEWSILSDHVKYVTFDGSETFNNLNIDQLNYRQDIDLYRELQDKELVNTDVNFGSSPDRLKAEYLDVHEGIYAKIGSSDRFDEDTDLSTTYLGQVNMTQEMEVKAEENFPITMHGYTKGKLLDGTECDILVDTGRKQVLYVQILLYEMQESAFFAKIHLHHNQNSSWQWTICRCFVHHTCHNDYSKSQIRDLYTCLQDP